MRKNEEGKEEEGGVRGGGEGKDGDNGDDGRGREYRKSAVNGEARFAVQVVRSRGNIVRFRAAYETFVGHLVDVVVAPPSAPAAKLDDEKKERGGGRGDGTRSRSKPS